ncbi:MAG: hypothetical protein LUQ71_01475 [Methanoregula sp.]|nr:hypothetical protein [Methanoregula sp.]
MDRVRLNEIAGIPLFLLPHTIAQQIRKTGDRIYRISVKRTNLHHYNVSVRIKSLSRELMPGGKTLAPSGPPANCRKGACAKGGAPS